MTKEQRQRLFAIEQVYAAFLADILGGNYDEQERVERLEGLQSAHDIALRNLFLGEEFPKYEDEPETTAEATT